MGLELAQREPVVRATLEEASALLASQLEVPLHEILAKAEHQSRTDLAQPALVALEVGLGRMWLARGMEPTAIVGHSVGEIAAACIAEAISFEDALKFAVERGRLMQTALAGGMAAIRADVATVERL